MGYNRAIKLTGDAHDAAVEYSNLDTDIAGRMKQAQAEFDNKLLKLQEEYKRRQLPILLRIAIPHQVDANDLPGRVIVLTTEAGTHSFILQGKEADKAVPEPEPDRPNVLMN